MNRFLLLLGRRLRLQAVAAFRPFHRAVLCVALDGMSHVKRWLILPTSVLSPRADIGPQGSPSNTCVDGNHAMRMAPVLSPGVLQFNMDTLGNLFPASSPRPEPESIMVWQPRQWQW